MSFTGWKFDAARNDYYYYDQAENCFIYYYGPRIPNSQANEAQEAAYQHSGHSSIASIGSIPPTSRSVTAVDRPTLFGTQSVPNVRVHPYDAPVLERASSVPAAAGPILVPAILWTATEPDRWNLAEDFGWQIGAPKFLWGVIPIERPTKTDKRELGRGSAGILEEVVMKGYNKAIARKTFSVSRWPKKASVEMAAIKKEVDIMISLSHRHIVWLFGCYHEGLGTHNHVVCTLMHPVGENDLANFLKYECKEASHQVGQQYREWIRNWFTCLAAALSYMHSRKVYHEDIKPSNIVHRGQYVYFTDFSSSRKLEQGEDTSTDSHAQASRLFAAPEAFPTFPDYLENLRHGSKTDVFSLGLVFIEMLSVYIAREVEGLRDFVFGDQKQGAQYHRVAEKLPSWFQSTAGEGMYLTTLQPMLRPNRHERPSAREVHLSLRGNHPNLGTGECVCG